MIFFIRSFVIVLMSLGVIFMCFGFDPNQQFFINTLNLNSELIFLITILRILLIIAGLLLMIWAELIDEKMEQIKT